ncbi:hypothetical protein [Nostoc sp.]|uniref:hypothetical protein n=1 Tax=Nostoc sp. TaxID=1180 RepID=UPI002FF46537
MNLRHIDSYGLLSIGDETLGVVEVELSIIQPYQLACSWIKVFVSAASLIRTAIITPF